MQAIYPSIHLSRVWYLSLLQYNRYDLRRIKTMCVHVSGEEKKPHDRERSICPGGALVGWLTGLGSGVKKGSKECGILRRFVCRYTGLD